MGLSLNLWQMESFVEAVNDRAPNGGAGSVAFH